MSEPPLTDAEYRALARFRTALRRFLAFSGDAARGAGVAPAQHQLLLAIRGHEGSAPSISAIAEVLLVKVHSATELAARAEANGLVRRHPDDDDGRRTNLTLTPRGEEVLAELSVVHREELRRFRLEMYDLLGELREPD